MKDTQGLLEDQFSFFDFASKSFEMPLHLGPWAGLCSDREFVPTQPVFWGDAQLSSSYRRVQRFLAEVSFPFDRLSQYIWNRFEGDETVVLSMDRTNWKFGRVNINILMLSICHDGMGIPLMWKILADKRGNSSQAERIELMERFERLIRPQHIVSLVADREFIGDQWLEWLDRQGFHYVIRIRNNQSVSHSPRKSQLARDIFPAQRWKRLRKQRTLGEVRST